MRFTLCSMLFVVWLAVGCSDKHAIVSPDASDAMDQDTASDSMQMFASESGHAASAGGAGSPARAEPTPADGGSGGSTPNAAAAGSGGSGARAEPDAAGSGGAPPRSAAPSAGPAPMQAPRKHTIDCTRAGLAELVQNYFEALEAHDPAVLPTAPNVKFTENAEALSLGQGLWMTAGKLVFERSALDVEECQTFTEALVEHPMRLMNQPEGPVIVGVRLKLENQHVSEIESFVMFDTQVAFSAMGLVSSASEDWKELLPADRCVPRDQLVASAGAYFEHRGNTPTDVPFGDPCTRRDNGVAAMSCENWGPEALNPLPVTHRRIPVVDVEAGIVVGTGLYVVAIPGFAMLKAPAGKIRFIDTGTAYFGQGATTSGWD